MSQFDFATNTWSGIQVDRSEYKVLSFRETVLKCLRSTPEKVFEICDDDGSKTTYSQVEVLAVRVAKNLQTFGVQPHDVISVFFKNNSLVAPLVFGCFLIGAPINPIVCQNMNVEWIRATFAISRPKVIILDSCSDSHELIATTLHEMGLNPLIFLIGKDQEHFSGNLLKIDELFKETGNEKCFKLSLDGFDDDSPVFIVPSSGTTGTPKGIVLSGNYCKGIKYFWLERDNPTCFSFSTISWFTGIVFLLFPILNNGLRIVSTKPFSPMNFGKIVKKHQITVSLLSTENLTSMYGSPDFNPDDFASIKELRCGGERAPTSVREFFKKQFKEGCFGILYGSTECGVVTNYDKKIDTSGIKDNIVGNLSPNVRSQIVDLCSTKLVGPNKVGEIFLATDMMSRSYYKNPELTAKAYDRCWFKTGDVGYFDDNGYLHVHGRIADMITVDGELIHPAEIEAVFEACKGIKSACAVSITDDNLLAVLCARNEGSTVNEKDLEKLKTSVNFEKLQFKGGIYIVKEIPRTFTNSRKIHRGDARALALELMTFRNQNNSLLNGFK